MCGVVAIKVLDDGYFHDNAERFFTLLQQTQLRGRDGFGWAINGKAYKVLGGPPEELKSELVKMRRGDSLIANSRAAPVTEGSVKLENVHPFTSRHWAVVHNGIITNDLELIQDYQVEMKSEVDSEVIAHLLDVEEPKDICEKLIGGFAFAANNFAGTLVVARNYKTLYQAEIGGAYVVASEREFLLTAFPTAVVLEFPVDSVATFGYAGVEVQKFTPQYKAYTPELDDQKALVVCSGGMDSSLVAYVCKKVYKMDVTIMHFNYGQKSWQMEWDAANTVAKQLGVLYVWLNLEWLGALGHSPLTDENIPVPLGRESSKSSLAWVPARNLVMLSIAAAYAEANGIKWVLYGSNLEEEGPAWKDNDLAAVEAFDKALYFGTLRGVRISNILGRLMKRDIVALGTYLGVPLESTCSCDEPVCQENGNWLACGRCGACQNRRHAFRQAEITDPQTYAYPMLEEYPSLESHSETDIENILSRLNPVKAFDYSSIKNVYWSRYED